MNHYQVSPCCLGFFFFKWKLFNLTSWHFWGFRTKLIAAAAAWSAVTKKPNSIINPCVSNLGDSGFPGEAVLFAVSHLLLPGVSLWELVVFRVFFLMPSSEVWGSYRSKGTPCTSWDGGSQGKESRRWPLSPCFPRRPWGIGVCRLCFEYFWVHRSAFSCPCFPSLVEKTRTRLGWKMLCRHWRRERVGMQFLIYPPRMGSACVSVCVLLSFFF